MHEEFLENIRHKEKRKRLRQRERNQVQQVCRGIGKLWTFWDERSRKDTRKFFERMRGNRKRQMEIAFLQAAVAELRRMEII